MEVIIVRLWYVLIYNRYYKVKKKIKKKMMSAYRGIRVAINPDEEKRVYFKANCEILVDKYKLKKLKSPFSSHVDFFTDSQLYIWYIDTSNYSKEPELLKPDEITYESICEYNKLPKLTIAYKLQANKLNNIILN